MKKIILSIIVIINIFILSSCAWDPASYYYEYDYLNTHVDRIELIYYDNEEAKELFNNRDKVKAFDFNKMKVIESLHTEKNELFIQEFVEIEFLLIWRHLDSPKDKCVKITYTNGNFDVFGCFVEFSCQYDSSGNVVNFIGSGGGYRLVPLVNKMFEIKI